MVNFAPSSLSLRLQGDRPVNVSLNDQVEKFVTSGRFKSSSAVIREGLRLLEERKQKLVMLRQEIEASRKSGEPIAFDANAIKRRGRKTPTTEKSYRDKYSSDRSQNAITTISGYTLPTKSRRRPIDKLTGFLKYSPPILHRHASASVLLKLPHI